MDPITDHDNPEPPMPPLVRPDTGSTPDDNISLYANNGIKEETSIKTECETPVSSPERDMAIKRKTRSSSSSKASPNGSSRSTSIIPAKVSSSNASCASADSGAEKDKDAEDVQDDYSNWPMKDIKDPCGNDVLYGRGGGTNHHEGNKRYRKMVEGRKVDYVNSKRLDKPLVALDIIKIWRDQKPPGRFLKYDEKLDLWNDVGDKKAREKTSQALREKAPLLRKQQEEQKREELEGAGSSETASPKAEQIKQTRFDVPVSQETRTSKKMLPATLARAHSLGVDYISPNEPVSIKGFSWDASEADPLVSKPNTEAWALRNKVPPSHYSYDEQGNQIPLTSTSESAASTSFEEPGYPTTPMNAPNKWQQHPQSYPSTRHSDQKIKEAWTSHRGYAHRDLRLTRSAEHDYRRSGSNSMDYNNSSQWHHGNDRNQGYNPEHSSVQPRNDYNRWDGYRNEYQYRPGDRGNPHDMYNHNRDHQQWASSPNRYSSQEYHPYPGQHSPPAHYNQHNAMNHPGSGGSSSYPSSSEHQRYRQKHPAPYENKRSPMQKAGLDFDSESSTSPSRSIPRPQPIKRDTSHQNENNETKSQIKRTNRQRSIGNRRPASLGEVSETEVNNLGNHLRQSSIGVVDSASELNLQPFSNINEFDIGDDIEGKSSPLDEMKSVRPKPIGYSNRGASVESINLDDISAIIGKPFALGESDRMGTLGSLDPCDFDSSKVAI